MNYTVTLIVFQAQDELCLGIALFGCTLHLGKGDIVPIFRL